MGKFLRSPFNKEEPILEICNFDTHYMKDATVKQRPHGYQEGKKYGYSNIKEYVKRRDHYTCQICKGKSKDKMLHVHHIKYRSQGGSDLEDNLLTVCKTCHEKIHNGTIKYKGKGSKSILKYAMQMNVISSQLQKRYPKCIKTYGYITKENRNYLNLSKTHYMDAVVIGTGGYQPIFLTQTVILERNISHGRYQQTFGSRSEKRYPKGKIQGFKTGDKVKYRNNYYFIRGIINGRYVILKTVTGETVKFEANSQYGKIPKLKDLVRVNSRRCTMRLEKKIDPYNP